MRNSRKSRNPGMVLPGEKAIGAAIVKNDRDRIRGPRCLPIRHRGNRIVWRRRALSGLQDSRLL
jgi:hypothetical protein